MQEVAAQVDAEHPWPGLTSFNEAAQAYFHGRDAEIQELQRLVNRAPLTVLFGQSGLGKSSLLQAGLLPVLRQQDFMPVLVRLDLSDAAQPLAVQLRESIREACAEHGAEFQADEQATSLWGFLRARDADIWSPRNRLLTPVLVIDQFEELFTLGQRSADSARRCAAFLDELADVVEQRMPQALAQRLEADPALAEAFTVQRPVKLVFSFREDHLPDFEGLRLLMPSVMHNRMRLTRMDGLQARAAILQSGRQLVSEAVAERIIRFVARAHGSGARALPLGASDDRLGHDEVEPALLSVVCRELNTRRIAAGLPQLTTELLDSGAPEQIISEFYERSFDGLASPVRDWVEDHLLTSGGFRNSEALEDAERRPGVSAEAIDELVRRRLLRREDRFGVLRVELTHDMLTSVARASRDRRSQQRAAAATAAREAARRQRLRWLIAGSALAGATAFGLALVFYVLLQNTREEQDKALRTQGQLLLAQAAASLERGIPSEPGAYLAQALRRAPGEPAIVARAVTLLSGQRAAPRLIRQEAASTRLPSPTGLRWRDGDLLELFGADDAMRLDTQTDQAKRLGFAATGEMHEDWGGLHAAFGLGDPAAGAASGNERRIVAYDPRTGVAVWRGREGRLIAIDTHTGARLSRPLVVPPGAHQVAVSPSLGWLAYVDAVRGLAVENTLANRQPASRAIEAPTSANWQPTALSDDGQVVLLDAGDGQWHVALWQGGRYRTASLGRLSLPPLLAGGGRAIVGVRDNDLLYAGIDDKGVSAWRLLLRHPLPVLSLDVDAGFKLAATGSLDRAARVIDTAKAALVGAPMPHHGAVTAVVLSADGKYVTTGARDGGARVWHAGAEQPLAEPAVHAAAVLNVAFDLGSSRLATLGADGLLSVWQLDLQPAGRAITTATPVRALEASPDGAQLAVALTDGSVAVWAADRTAETGLRPLWQSPPTGRAGTALAFDTAGRYLALGREDGSVASFTAADGAPGPTLTAGTAAVRRMAYSPDGTLLATAAGRAVKLWRLPSAQLQRLQMTHERPVEQLRFSPDGRRLATAMSSPTSGGGWEVRVWDSESTVELPPALKLAEGERVGHLAWPAGAAEPLVLGGTWEGLKPWSGAQSRDGRLLFGGGADGAALVLDRVSGQRLGVPMRHDNAVLGASFSADNRWLVSRAADGRVRVWDVRSGTAVADAMPADAELPATLVDAGRSLILVDDSGTLRRIELGLDFPLPQPDWLPRLLEAAAGAELDERQTVVPMPQRLQRLLDLRDELQARPAGWWRDWGLAALARLIQMPTPPNRTATPEKGGSR